MHVSVDKRIYLSKVQEIDHNDDEVFISFMSLDMSLNSLVQVRYGLKETQSPSISHHLKEQREVPEFHKKF